MENNNVKKVIKDLSDAGKLEDFNETITNEDFQLDSLTEMLKNLRNINIPLEVYSGIIEEMEIFKSSTLLNDEQTKRFYELQNTAKLRLN